MVKVLVPVGSPHLNPVLGLGPSPPRWAFCCADPPQGLDPGQAPADDVQRQARK